MTRLVGKVALITGGGTGIGRAIALAFAREGAKVAVAGRRREKLEETLREVEKLGGEGLAIVCDVSKAKDARACGEGDGEGVWTTERAREQRRGSACGDD